MLKVRDAIPQIQPLAVAEFKTIQIRLIKIAARITETAKRIRVTFAAACLEADRQRLCRYITAAAANSAALAVSGRRATGRETGEAPGHRRIVGCMVRKHAIAACIISRGVLKV